MDWSFLRPVIAGQLRHLATVAAGYLLAHGLIESGDQAAFVKIVGSIGMWVIIAGWSWYQKVGHARAVAALKSAGIKVWVALLVAGIGTWFVCSFSAVASAQTASTAVSTAATVTPAVYNGPYKAPALPAYTPCTATACSGPYVGAFIGGVGSNADIVGNGINGSVFAGGGIPGLDFGYQYYDSKTFLAAELMAGYQFNTNASANGVSGNENGWLAIEQAKAGLSLASLFQGSNTTVNLTLPNLTLLAPYFAVGGIEHQGLGAGWATGAGIEFDVSSHIFIDVEYLYANYGSTSNGSLTTNSENLVFVKGGYKF